MARLIDADTLSAKMYHEAFETDTDEQKWDSGCWIRYKMFERILAEQPTVQPERKEGKWIIRDNPGTGWYRVTCSECGEDVTSTIPMIGFFPNATPLWDYCPYCGAKMEVEDNGKQ